MAASISDRAAPKVSLVSEQGTKMGRQSFIHIELTYRESTDIPSRIEVGGSVMPVLKSEPLWPYALAVAASLTG